MQDGLPIATRNQGVPVSTSRESSTRRVRLPSLKSLRTFQIAGRYLSFKDAAEELAITASAVSHQIRNLESDLNVRLFERGTRSLKLTEAGRSYFEFLDGMFGRLEDETLRLTGQLGRQTLRLCVPPFFASEALLPKLGSFEEKWSKTDILVTTQPSEMKTHSADADLTVLVDTGPRAHLVMHRLFARHAVAACSPALAAKLKIERHADLNDKVLIVHEKRKETWQQWSETMNIPDFKPRKLLRFDSMSDVVSAAEQSLGIALISWPLGEGRLKHGSLVRLFEEEMDTGESFFLAYRPDDAQRREVRALIDWVVAEFGQDA